MMPENFFVCVIPRSWNVRPVHLEHRKQ